MKNKALRVVGLVLMIASAGFICYRLFKLDLSSLDFEFTTSSVSLMIAALLLETFTVLFLGLLFSRNIGKGRDGSKVPVKEAVLVYCRANLGKYIPGNVFQYVERNLFFSTYGISHTDTVIASLLEVMCLIVSACVLSLAFGNYEVIGEAIEEYGYIIPVLCVLAVLVVIVGVIVLRKKKKSLGSILKRLKERGGFGLIALDLVCYAGVLLAMGTVTLIVCSAMIPAGADGPELTGLLGAYIAAWLCGFIIIGAPGGIGVREAVFSLIYINTPYLDTVLTLSVVVRVISIIADVLAFVIIRLICGRKLSQSDPKVS
ncbi:MAG: flippase-like domain-containing protein [Lachnospiraceae bacterium]|nr:flippase-like domain-containing protein [Lachnospiraceae bacterium]